LVDRRLGLKRLSDHFLIQFSKLNKNMAVWMIQVCTKRGKFNSIENRRKIDFLTPFQIFRFFEWKDASKRLIKHIFLLAIKFSIEWRMKHRKKSYARILLCVHLINKKCFD
jgi:hypothetical protein